MLTGMIVRLFMLIALTAVVFVPYAPASALTQLPPNAIIIDDGDAGFQQFGTQDYWKPETGSPNDYFNGDMVWTWNYNLVVDNYARWSLPLTRHLADDV